MRLEIAVRSTSLSRAPPAAARALPVLPARKDPLAHRVPLARRERLVQQVPLAQLVRKVQPAPLVQPARKALLESVSSQVERS